MRKDIKTPEVKDVYVAAIKEANTDFNTEDWNAYIINDGQAPLEMVLIVSQGYDAHRKTSQFRHSIKVLPAKGYAKIEFMEDSVLALTNSFAITYFLDNKMYEKRWEFPANSILEEHCISLPIMDKKGVLAK